MLLNSQFPIKDLIVQDIILKTKHESQNERDSLYHLLGGTMGVHVSGLDRQNTLVVIYI